MLQRASSLPSLRRTSQGVVEPGADPCSLLLESLLGCLVTPEKCRALRTGIYDLQHGKPKALRLFVFTVSSCTICLGFLEDCFPGLGQDDGGGGERWRVMYSQYILSSQCLLSRSSRVQSLMCTWSFVGGPAIIMAHPKYAHPLSPHQR